MNSMFHTHFKMINIMTQNRSHEVGYNDFIFIFFWITHIHFQAINEIN